MSVLAADRALSAGAFLGGCIELAVAVGAVAFGATRVRRLLLPGWSGAPARLVEVVLASAALLWVSEITGTFGGFADGWVIAGSLLVGLGAAVAANALAASRPVTPAPAPPAPPSSSLAKVLAVAVLTALVAAWMIPTLGSVAAGMDRADSLWYHMPFAARFVQTGHTGSIFFFDPVFFASFYPANSEVFHALGILFFDRDLLSLIINDGWLAVSLLACYCIGRPYGVGPQAMIGGSVALGAQMLVEFQAGEGLNDITGLAFLLAAGAILVNAWAAWRKPAKTPPPLPAIAAAGLAGGMAAGVKLSFLAPLAALTAGVVYLAGSGLRRRVALAFLVPMLAAGGYWYARNLLAIGNPIPYIHHLGPISLPAPDRDFSLRPGFSVFHYWNDPTVWSNWFAPGLHENLGLFWPVTLVGVVAITAAALLGQGVRMIRLLAIVAGFAALAYVFTPLTASGVQGQPIGFVWNLRYLAPSIAIAFAVLPCLPFVRADPRRRTWTMLGLFVLAAVTIASLVQWKQGHVKGAVAAALIVLAIAAALAYARSRGVRWWALRLAPRLGIVAAVVAAVIAGGYKVQRQYMQHRYEDAGSVPDMSKAFAWVRGVSDSKIALAGVRAIFTQYAFYGPDLSNRVQWLGAETAHDGYSRIATCREWYAAVNAGGYRYVVATHDPYDPGVLRTTPESRWTGADPSARLIVREGPVHIFALDGPLDPAHCAGQRPLTNHQLHGVPDPTNPQ